MTVGQLRSFIENMPGQAPVRFFQGGAVLLPLKLLEYDESKDRGISFWVDEKSEL